MQLKKAPDTDNTPLQTSSYTPHTYATVAQQNIPATHLTVITQGEMSGKQMLLQKDPKTKDSLLHQVTEKELVVKANMTVDLMGVEAED